MKKNIKHARLLALLISAVMVITSMSFAVFADDDPVTDTGYTVTYTAGEGGTVAVEGSEEAVNSIASTDTTEGVTGATATADENYEFDGWYKDDVKISGDAVLSADLAVENLNKTDDTAYADTEYVAKFNEKTVEPEPEPEPIPAADAPAGLSASVSGNIQSLAAKLQWGEVSNGDYTVKYAVTVLDANGRDVYSAEGLTQTSVSLPEGTVKAGTSYTFKVGAALERDGETGETSWSDAYAFNTPAVIAAPVITAINVPDQTLADGEGQRTKHLTCDNLITIKWSSSATDVSSFMIKRTNGDLLRSQLPVNTTSYSFSTKAGTYSYVVRAYYASNPAVYAESAPKSSGYVRSYISSVHTSWSWTATMDKKVTLYKKGTGSAKIKTLAKGTKGTIIGTYPKSISKWNKPSRVKIKLADGTVGFVPYSAISASPNITTSQDYTLRTKLAFANKYSSKTQYLIWVNGYTQRINIFKGKKGSWKLVSSNRVTLGNFYQPVSTGTKKLGSKKGTVTMLDDKGRPYYFKYARTFGGSGYFHTRSYWSNNNKPKNKVQYRPATKGCIRQYTDDAKFLYSLPKGTTIIFK